MIGDLDLAPTRAPNAVEPRANAIAWSVAALIVGTIVAVDPAGLVPTGPLRFTAIAGVAGVAVCALLWRPVKIPRPIMALWIALIGVLLLATINAVDSLHAWIGTPDRRLGLIVWLTLPALFLVGYACNSRAATQLICRAGTVGALVLGAWTLAELVGRPPLGLEFADARAGGPFGQPAYLGAACLLIGPLAAATALDKDEARSWRRVAALGVIGAVVALAASQTRAAWVGAAVAAIATAVQHRRRLARFRAPLFALAAVVIVIGAITPLGGRATSTFDLDHGTSAGRLDEWRIATRVIADHPLLGVGPEGYRVVFPQEDDAAYVRKYGIAVYPDRAHNGILDVTAIGGIPAGLLYAALLGVLLMHAWRALRRNNALDLALGVAVIAYAVQQLFLFPLAELEPIFWALAGMLVFRTAGDGRVMTMRARWLVVPVAVATAAGVAYGAREVLADRELKQAANTTNPAAALRHADDATQLRPDSIRTWYVAARVAQRGDALTDIDAALDRVQHGLDRSPRDPALRVLYGQLLVERAERSGLADDIRTARAEIDRLVEDAPHDPRLRNAQVSAHSLREIGKP